MVFLSSRRFQCAWEDTKGDGDGFETSSVDQNAPAQAIPAIHCAPIIE